MTKVFSLDLVEVVNYYFRDKLSLERIGYKMGCSPGKVASTLKQSGYSLRTSHESQILHFDAKEKSIKESSQKEALNTEKYAKYFIDGQYEMFCSIASYSPSGAIGYLDFVNPERIERG